MNPGRWPRLRLLLGGAGVRFIHKQGQRRRVPMQEVLPGDRSYFTIAEESGQSDRPERLLDRAGVVVDVSE